MKQMWETGKIQGICEKNEFTSIYAHTFPHSFYSLVSVVAYHSSLNYHQKYVLASKLYLLIFQAWGVKTISSFIAI